MNEITANKLNELQGLIGNTPLIKLGEGVFGKLESRNPAGSVKDRAAFYILKNALLSGELTESGEVVEATSGNTGIGLAYVCSKLGIRFTAVMPSCMSKERIALMEKLGAAVLLTPAEEGMTGAVNKANALAANGAYLAGQFSNVSGIQAHYETTAPEIFSALPDAKYIICGVGSGGTAMGIKKYILDKGIDCKVIAVEPAESPMLLCGHAGAHKIQGIGANFLPALVDKTQFDGIEEIASEDAVSAVKSLYAVSGKKCGISSAAAYLAALKLRRDGATGNIVVILPDGGDRYDDALYV